MCSCGLPAKERAHYLIERDERKGLRAGRPIAWPAATIPDLIGVDCRIRESENHGSLLALHGWRFAVTLNASQAF
jgi:hypothetical protein